MHYFLDSLSFKYVIMDFKTCIIYSDCSSSLGQSRSGLLGKHVIMRILKICIIYLRLLLSVHHDSHFEVHTQNTLYSVEFSQVVWSSAPCGCGGMQQSLCLRRYLITGSPSENQARDSTNSSINWAFPPRLKCSQKKTLLSLLSQC